MTPVRNRKKRGRERGGIKERRDGWKEMGKWMMERQREGGRWEAWGRAVGREERIGECGREIVSKGRSESTPFA